jgi:hypothetical protein
MMPRLDQDLPLLQDRLPPVVEEFPQGARLGIDDVLGGPLVDLLASSR